MAFTAITDYDFDQWEENFLRWGQKVWKRQLFLFEEFAGKLF